MMLQRPETAASEVAVKTKLLPLRAALKLTGVSVLASTAVSIESRTKPMLLGTLGPGLCVKL